MVEGTGMASGAAVLPRPEWPVDWQPVWGTRGGLLSHAEYLAARGILALLVRTPEPVVQRLLGGLARLAALVQPERRRCARDFVRTALGELEAEQVERHVVDGFRHLFRVAVDTERFLHRVPPERMVDHFDIRWTDEVRRVLEAGGGQVLITGHVGNWEVATAVAAQVGFAPVYAIAKPIKNLPMSKAVQRSRESRGVRLLPRRGAMRDAQKIIRSNGTLAMLVDQRARLKPIVAPFFGRPATCDRSVGVLLRRLRVPVVPFAVYMTERPLHFRAEFERVLWPEDLVGADPLEIAKRVNGVLERLILAQPDQYVWIHDRYRGCQALDDAAAGEASSGEAMGGAKAEAVPRTKEGA